MHTELRLIIAIITGLTCSLSTAPVHAEDWGPWEAVGVSRPQQVQPDDNPLDRAIHNFQKYISPLDGARCPMYPTCSAYARQALNKHGPLLGIFMTADRLIHEGDPNEQQDPIIKWGHRRYFDPLEKNDYWLKKDRSD